MIARRSLLTGGAGLLLAGCDRVVQNPTARRILFAGEDMQRGLQRALSDRAALAPEFRPDQMSPIFRANGTHNPGTPEYAALAQNNFADWRLAVGGLVDTPRRFTLAQLRTMPARTQITRHDCVEGWSAIGQWTGPLLGTVLKAAGVRRSARYVVFHCADLFGGIPYYESIDMVDAFHSQTILAWGMNGHMLDVAHGAPLRLRVERQLGYKHAKYLMRIDAVASLDGIGLGKGGYWEDHVDYDWYAGI
ncbi:molybdopterin-dependent oxidoreductase [Sphingomonas carotinifaciens]|uniref:DMSO/TMAO reductase YedYZ, molybdopterin-dependent catalytic subunit n=1 Tax=Sphingomonas carotinifaciens TaxID=1166323 RepID=A0A1G7L7Q4_9SPHN|nr:molybdopterin-dependent oxidoreductase [Sphingomonas carotinifaciens]MBB4085562.1 DMSO/TMAO reductase YedYZ molybdopterin-dependent catalytic subunit [Sphingomonas carotinifaciens]MWC43417.1 molybdopterin-dependent oxidoreductase [Sphingomonas carotinifaciens]SDF45475.1 DMSO/TMAO reductase YedYZ, molybdopterin-dependent catalytic subunit [Sphingomonas carotinifaciens]